MKKVLFEVNIPSCVEAAELSGLLDEPDFLGAWEQDGVIRLYWQGPKEEVLSKVEVGLQQLGVALSRECMALLSVEDKDWNAQWAALVQPVRIGRRFFIRPSWGMSDFHRDGIELVLDPRQAFGTGHHATTQLLLEWLEEVIWHPGDRVLDVGTGSGILCMGALRLGATSSVGIDIDPMAIACAQDYARINGFHTELEFHEMGIHEVPQLGYAVILANVDRRTLLSLCPAFSRLCAEKTTLYLSGLLQEDEEDIRAAFQKEGWMHQGTRTREGWIAIQLVNSPPPVSSSGCDSR